MTISISVQLMLSKAFLTFVKIYKNKNLLETKLNVGSRFSKHGSKLNIMPICRYNLSSLTNICKNSEEQSKAKNWRQIKQLDL